MHAKQPMHLDMFVDLRTFAINSLLELKLKHSTTNEGIMQDSVFYRNRIIMDKGKLKTPLCISTK